LPHSDLLSATVSCSGLEITIQCNDHGVKDRLMDFLTGDAAQPTRLTDQELRKLWRDAGGEFYGPRVETWSMPEAKLLPFLRALASQPSPAATVETLNEQAREHPRYDNPRDPFASPDRLPPSSSADNADELKQCHDDLDTLNVPRLEGGLTLSVPGRILLMARRRRMTLPNADWLRRKTETDHDLECEAGPDLSRDGPQTVPQEEDCGCIGAVIGQHERSCPLSRPQSRSGE
jgi:hypothetical protein